MLLASAELRNKILFTLLALLLATLAFLSPILSDSPVAPRIGFLLIWAGILEILHGFRRLHEDDRHAAWWNGALTLLMAIAMINAELLAGGVMIKLIGLLFIFDTLRFAWFAIRSYRQQRPWIKYLLAFAGNLTIVILLLLLKGEGFEWSISIVSGLRIIGTAYSVYTIPTGLLEDAGEDVVSKMNLPGHPEILKLAQKIEEDEDNRADIDRAWIITFIIILFAIHLGRMGFDRSKIGILSPLIAVIGDIVIALIIAFAIIGPLRNTFRRVSGSLARSAWNYVLQVPDGKRKAFTLRNLVYKYLKGRLRLGIRMRKSGYSFFTAIRSGLQIGLPFSALLAATVPVFGMSWYFDTENWAAGIWDNWAAARTDAWRSAMIEASGEKAGPNAFRLQPEGVKDNQDFSFIVIGDPGEGDASQLILKDQLVASSANSSVKFVVISSDVVYPDGAMKMYEKNFWLPFKGVSKPIYAIPGNHDWYDALEGFNAVFLQPDIARRAMQARVSKDLVLTEGKKEKIEDMLKEAAWLRREYNIPTGFQQAPFFQVQTGLFVLITVDTGILRQVDNEQLDWLKQVLENSKDKFVMVLLGHPFYAIGEYQGSMNEKFEALHKLFRQYKVPLVMAGDTHDLEYYIEKDSTGHTMHHFVNGGGGAYLSIGAALKKPDQMPTADWAIYPSTDPLVKKIESNIQIWKKPAWWWTKKYDGWPFSAEWLSAAFDYNKAPYFQSFIEVKVEPSQNRIRFIPMGVNGRLKWSEMRRSPTIAPGVPDETLAEWILPLKK